ncbi:hypothetical protein SADUNF_Sadunf01G0124800 [Salix dunnii]|uniref:Uncharacterized protein n=1 Tax=Salix dunnii TaxID=1413687 RepID=A0A835NAU8_9ROSI|nr:hypothetical protein SADUNF_Sadunf01G0124800 [Salix dunnii]
MKDSGSSSFDSKCEPSTSFDSSSTSGCSSLSGFPVAVDLAKEDQLVEGEGTDEITVVDGGDCTENSLEDLEFIEEAELRLKAIWVLVRISQDKEVIHCMYTRGMVLKRGLPSKSTSNNVFSEFSTKRSKVYDNHLCFVTPKPSLKTETGKSFERWVKSLDIFKWTPRASVGDESVKCDERLLKTVDAIPAKSKRAKRLNTNPSLGSPRSSLVSETERRRENFGYSVEKLGSEGGGCSNRCLKSPQNEQVGEMLIEVNSSARECSGESSAKRKLELFTENKMDDLEKLSYVGPSVGTNACGKEEDVREKRVLPASVPGRKENAGSGEAEHDIVLSDDLYGSSDHTIRCVGDTSEEEQYDPSLEKLSILEAAEIGEMTFP